eukprot:JP448633.1.p3 GENE.JP448633.1~~JP448633.1.p3  ORF type:complete len:64 (+),score=10.83 JP448633.1:180-371(+)
MCNICMLAHLLLSVIRLSASPFPFLFSPLSSLFPRPPLFLRPVLFSSSLLLGFFLSALFVGWD